MEHRNHSTFKGRQVLSKLSGEMVDSNSEEWRHECEVAHVVGKMTRPQRVRYLETVGTRRGQDAVKKIKDDSMVLWAVKTIMSANDSNRAERMSLINSKILPNLSARAKEAAAKIMASAGGSIPLSKRGGDVTSSLLE